MAQNRKDNYQDNEFVKINDPFKDDLLGRKKNAQLWQDTLLKSGKHFVMAVDAEWGMGKSYFARNWECKLLHDDYKVCYIDAFEYDFTDDPFMTISSSIIEILKVNDGFTELEEITNYLGVLYKSLKTNSLNLFGSIIEGAAQFALGTLDHTGSNPIINGIAKVAGSVINVITNSFKEAGKSDINPMSGLNEQDITYHHVIQAFKILLKDKVKELTKDSNKSFIVIVDELDRCKPSFAIEFLEKLKHLFDIPNIIFILFINEKELASAISHTYGVNGGDYLGKFINFKIELKNKNENLETSKIMSFIERKFNFDNIKVKPVANEFDKDKNINPIHDLIKTLHVGLDLSFRDIINLHMFCEFISDFIEDEYNFAFLIILKALQITHHEVYNQLINIENIRIYNQMNIDKQNIELPAFMKYKDEQAHNRFLKVFSLLWEKIYLGTDDSILDYIGQQRRIYRNTNNNEHIRKNILLGILSKSSENMNVKTFHQYIDKLILYINLDISDMG